jgi:acyl-CoA dehydrogenase family protein 9
MMLVKAAFRRSDWPLSFKDPTMNRAARFARSSARWIRLMILAGFSIYGRSISKKQFFLRRVTTLSLYLYAIVAMLARVETARQSGRDVSADLNVLSYFLEEARQARKLNRHLFSVRQEHLHHRIASDIVQGKKQTGDFSEERVGGVQGAEVSQEAN